MALAPQVYTQASAVDFLVVETTKWWRLRWLAPRCLVTGLNKIIFHLPLFCRFRQIWHQVGVNAVRYALQNFPSNLERHQSGIFQRVCPRQGLQSNEG